MGPASPHFVTGRYSRFMPARLLANYEASTHDPLLLNLREEIRLVDARLTDLLQRVDSGESGQLWERLGRVFARFREARAKREMDAAKAAMLDLETLLEEGHTDHLAWREIGVHLELRRKLVESETRRVLTSQQVLNQTEAMIYMAAVTQVITQNVTDKTVLAAIIRELQRIILHQSKLPMALTDHEAVEAGDSA
jgi:hypothetical protein